MAKAKRPAIVTAMGVLGMIGALFTILSGLFIMLDKNRVADLAITDLTNNGAIWFGAIITLFGAFGVYLASSLLSGARWTRVWYTVVGAINLISGLWLLISHSGESRWSGLVTVVVWLVVLQLLYNDKADAFFDEG